MLMIFVVALFVLPSMYVGYYLGRKAQKVQDGQAMELMALRIKELERHG
jgi:hypothetical protein